MMSSFFFCFNFFFFGNVVGSCVLKKMFGLDSNNFSILLNPMVKDWQWDVRDIWLVFELSRLCYDITRSVENIIDIFFRWPECSSIIGRVFCYYWPYWWHLRSSMKMMSMMTKLHGRDPQVWLTIGDIIPISKTIPIHLKTRYLFDDSLYIVKILLSLKICHILT